MKIFKKILGCSMLFMGGFTLGMSKFALYPEQYDKDYWYLEIVIGVLVSIAGCIYISEVPLVKEIKNEPSKVN